LVSHTLMFRDDTIQNNQLQNSSINLSYGSGISGSSSVALGGTLTLNNTGVLSTAAGSGVSVSGSTGNVTIANTGVLSNLAGTGISVSSGTGNVTISNTGVLSVAGDGAILTSTGGQNPVVSVASQSANKVLAGPTSGGPGSAAFRALVAADVPDLGASYIKNGTSQQSSANFNISGNGTLGGSLTANNATINQAADGDNLLSGKRATDSGTPTGNFMRFRNAANATDLWAVDVSGTLTAGTVPAAHVSGTLSNSTTGNASTASAFDHLPTQCSSGFSTGITATGAANCSTNGSALTTLTAANISAGTAGINITGTATNVTGTVGIGNGGTGLSLASVAAGSYLRGTGTGLAVSTIQAGDLPSLSGTYVDFTSNQLSIGGNKTFTGTVTMTSPTMSNTTINQAANGNDAISGKRATDSSPTGNFEHFKDAANTTDLWTVDATGTLTAGTIPSARVSGNINGNAANVTGTVAVGNGGTGRTTLTAHGVLLGEGTSAINQSPAGTSGQAFLSAGASADGAYGSLNLAGGSSVVTGQLPVSNGGTGLSSGTSGGILGFTASGTLASSAALTANGIVLGGGAGATPTSTAALTNGQVLIGSTGVAPVPATLTAGSNVTITNAAGSITIAAAGSANPSFSALTTGTNTTAAMTVGAGASLSTSGSGTINATALSGELAATAATANTIAARDGSANLTANQFNGSGAGLTSLNASNITTGTIAGVRIAPTRGNIATATFTAPNSPATNFGSTATAVATCTTGVLLSGGGQVSNNDSPANPLETVMIESYPSSSTQWTVTGVTNALAKNKTMTVNAWAICSGS
jgi:hypothetical protein